VSTKSKGAERRRLYRPTTTRSDVIFEVISNDGNAYAGEIVGATVEGTGAFFSNDTAPRLEIGEQVKLAFTAPDLSERVEIGASVASCLVQSTRWRYGFRFHERVEAPENAATPFYRIFNRRRTYRLAPEPEHLVPVSLETEQCSVACLMRDISTTGAGIICEAELPSEHGAGEAISLSFQLPGSDRPSRFVARVRHHTTEDGLHHYGLEFDQATTDDFESQQHEIMQYVMRRLLE
jgi:hypothetical protein